MSASLFFVPPEPWGADDRSLTAAVDTVRGPLVADVAEWRTAPTVLRDSPDRRLARQGMRLCCTPAGEGREVWSLFDSAGEVIAKGTVALPAPTFSDEVPKGGLRAHLEDLTQGRALQPVAEITVTEILVALRDEDAKIRCRLVFTIASTGDGAAEADLAVQPLKGYERDAKRVRARVTDSLGWIRSPTPALIRLRSIAGAAPGTAGWDLRADDPAGPAMREILSVQLDVMEDRLPGVLADRHPDYLHQFRVAIRRTRSALSQLTDAIALEGRAEAVEGFRWLGRITSPVRDLDVQLLDLAERRARMEGDPHALDALERHLETLKKAAHRDLVLALTGDRFQAFLSRWRDSLNPSSANWTATESLRAPFADIVTARAVKLLRKVLREGRKIGPETEAERLHDLRKRMKKLRYVTEFLSEILPRDRSKPAIKALKGLQDVLGRVQDREVQVEALHGYGRTLASRKGVGAETLMTIGAWSEELDRDRRAARDAFAAAFETFAARETQALFHDIFDGPAGDQPGRRRPKED